MTRKGLVTMMTIISMLLTFIPTSSSIFAATNTQLIVHYHKKGGNYTGNLETLSLNGQVKGTVSEKTTDGFGLKMTYQFPNIDDNAYIGVVVKEDSAFPEDKRFVRAKNGKAEIWLIDGDARVYNEPLAIDSKIITKKDNKGYVTVEDLKDVLNLTYKYGKNTYKFDGANAGTADILTIYHNRDYFEININTNRIGSNVTGNMTSAYTDLVFHDVDGYKDGNNYYLSIGYIERLFQVAVLADHNKVLLLKQQNVAYDQVTRAKAPEDVGFSSEKLSKIDDYINQQVESGFPAAAMIVVKDGKVVKESAYGYLKKYDTPFVDGAYKPAALLPKSDWEEAKVDSLFDMASNTKMYATNYAIQKLVSEGKLNLDRPLSSFPGWENFKDSYTVYTGKWTLGGSGGLNKTPRTGKETVTIRDILHHYGGLIPDPEYPNKNSAGDLWYQTNDHTNRAGVIDVICKTPLQYTPRTTYAYSDVDFMILGLLVEQITGMPLDEYVEKHIYNKMGLTHSVFNPLTKGFSKSQIAATELNGNTRDGFINFGKMEDNSPVNIRKYTLQGEVHDEKAWYAMAGVAGHAGLFSTAGDMGVLTQLMLNGGIYNGTQFFTKEVADEFTTPYDPDPNKVDSSTTGLGWRVHSKSAAAYYYFNWGPSRSTYGHQGWTGTLTIIDPVYNMSITILTNLRHSPVVSPPNGFAGSNFPIANLVPISALVYDSLVSDKEQYSPDAPITLSAKATGIKTVDLSWNTVSGADSYNVYRSTTSDGAFQKINIEPLATNSFTDTGLHPGSEYYYKVTALNSVGESAQSEPVHAATVSASDMYDLIGKLIKKFADSGELGGPMKVQLTNSLKQSEDQYKKGHKAQAIKSSQDFLKHMDNQGLQKHITKNAKEALETEVNILIEALTD
ncbi:penicillin binding protein PBP4B [Neobacillus sp. NPDC093127]|uniref:penicillin binding protein PBP4B n=1 Tax=Neobacillus sp. NPDC093127 TaxID=3364296 RepID=UPI0037F6B7CB